MEMFTRRASIGRILPLCCFLITLNLAILALESSSVVHASKGHPRFSIQPSFAPPFDSKPRGYFIYNSKPGSTIMDSIHITNDGTARGTLYLSAVDALTGPTGGTVLRRHNDDKNDVGAWVQIRQPKVTLDPGTSTEVAFTVTIPRKVRPGQHGGGILAEAPSQPQRIQATATPQMQVDMQALIGLGVLINLPGRTREQLRATSLTYDQDSVFPRVLIGLQNSGTQLLYPQGKLEILDEQGHSLQSQKLDLRTFVPQTSISYPLYLQNVQLQPDKIYIVKLYVRYGHGHELRYAGTFQLPSPPQNPLQQAVKTLAAAASNPNNALPASLLLIGIVVGLVTFAGLSVRLFMGGRKTR